MATRQPYLKRERSKVQVVDRAGMYEAWLPGIPGRVFHHDRNTAIDRALALRSGHGRSEEGRKYDIAA